MDLTYFLRKLNLHPDDDVDASPITEKLWMGGHPPAGPGLAKWGFDALILAAREFQLSAEHFPDVIVLHAPMHDDHKGIPHGEAVIALHAAKQVVQWIKAGKKVLVTCWQGRNRSGIITALALLELTKLNPKEIAFLIRASRGPAALSNGHFVHLLNTVNDRRQQKR